MKEIDLLKAFAKDGELTTEQQQAVLCVDHRTVQRLRARIKAELDVQFCIASRRPTMWAVSDWGFIDPDRILGGDQLR